MTPAPSHTQYGKRRWCKPLLGLPRAMQEKWPMRSAIRVVVATREVREIRKSRASTVIHVNLGTGSKPNPINLCSPKTIYV